MLNPEKKFVKSEGIDLPLMQVYLVGRISGECMNKCVEWRKQIINHYRDYKPIFAEDGETITYESYPISFISPLNSGESKTADKLGLKSHIPRNLIYDKDILSLRKADIVVANLDDFMENGIEEELNILPHFKYGIDKIVSSSAEEDFDFKEAFFKLQDKIKNRRANLGSHFETSIALYEGKPVILIAGSERNKYILENHPFFSRASVIVLSVEELLEKKWIQILYKAMAGSTVE